MDAPGLCRSRPTPTMGGVDQGPGDGDPGWIPVPLRGLLLNGSSLACGLPGARWSGIGPRDQAGAGQTKPTTDRTKSTYRRGVKCAGSVSTIRPASSARCRIAWAVSSTSS